MMSNSTTLRQIQTPSKSAPQKEEDVDLLVIGSGAAGLSAALFAAKQGLSVLVCEKSQRLGGTTALSNGMIWIPCSQQAVKAGIKDSLDQARTYLKGELGQFYRPDFIEALLNDGPEAISELEKDTEVRFALAAAPDYHSARPGGVDKGRALSPVPFDGRRLKDDFELIGDPIRVVLGGMMISSSEINNFLSPFRSLKALRHVLRRVSRYSADRMRFRRGTELSGGNALIARFLVSLRQRQVTIWTSASLRELIIRNGRAIGGVVEGPSGAVKVNARYGVVLATGGFARNPVLRSELSGLHPHEQTLTHPDVTGDGINLALQAGASVDTEVRSAGFWTPVSLLGENGKQQTVPYGWLDRGRPGVIAVGPDGRRFVNESNSYHDICLAMFDHGYPKDDRFFFICDHDFILKRGMGHILPWPWTLALRKYEQRGYIQTGSTINDLALQIGIEPNVLQATVDQHNHNASRGIDPDFQRGESAFNRTLGDPAVGTKNPNLGPIQKAPFIALRILPATLGTAVGLKTDTDGRVLSVEGWPIDGLFACGNDMTSPMRGIYPGAGITIGPAIVFAYRVINAIVRQRETGHESPSPDDAQLQNHVVR
ncbi:FAD-dependent oxidoreductase [Paraburkholderia sp. EG287A]|uniref:FAD-dependent oxidoreductase n=1 Tax=unclassified Paraburkholderia TaxID=2615204 RepID=UPI0034D1C733